MTSSRHRYAYRKRWLYSHFWTVFPHLSGRFVAEPDGLTQPWLVHFDDPVMGATPASGIFHPTPNAQTWWSLFMDWVRDPPRAMLCEPPMTLFPPGTPCASPTAEPRPQTITTQHSLEIHEAMSCKQLRPYNRRFVLGYSLGGHLALRFAMESEHRIYVPSRRSVLPSTWLDVKWHWMHRRSIYTADIASPVCDQPFAEQGSGARLDEPSHDEADLDAIQTIRDWDNAVVVPRFGYRVRRYCISVSRAPFGHPEGLPGRGGDPRSDGHDRDRQPYLSTPRIHSVVTEKGGHVGFPQVDLGPGPAHGLVPQIRSWFDAQQAPPPGSGRNAPDVNWAGYGQYGPR